MFAVMVSVQGTPLPAHAPPNSWNDALPLGERLTVVPARNSKLQKVSPLVDVAVAEHWLVPDKEAGASETVPVVVPSVVTSSLTTFRESVYTRVKLAPTVLSAFIVISHVPVPVQAPVHPVNRHPGSGAGVSVTTALGA